MHLSGSSNDEPSDLKDNNRPLLPANSSLRDTNVQSPQYSDRDGGEIDGEDVELGSVSSPLGGIEDLSPSIRWVDSRRLPRSSIPKNSAIPLLPALGHWISGPQPPRRFRIEPLLPRLQSLPISILDARFSGRKQKVWLFAVVCLCWSILFTGILTTSIYGCNVSGYSSPTRLSCISRFW